MVEYCSINKDGKIQGVIITNYSSGTNHKSFKIKEIADMLGIGESKVIVIPESRISIIVEE